MRTPELLDDTATMELCFSCGIREQYQHCLCEPCLQQYAEENDTPEAERLDPLTHVTFRDARRWITATIESLLDNGRWAYIRVVAVDGPSAWVVGECYSVPAERLQPVPYPAPDDGTPVPF